MPSEDNTLIPVTVVFDDPSQTIFQAAQKQVSSLPAICFGPLPLMWPRVATGPGMRILSLEGIVQKQ